MIISLGFVYYLFSLTCSSIKIEKDIDLLICMYKKTIVKYNLRNLVILREYSTKKSNEILD